MSDEKAKGVSESQFVYEGVGERIVCEIKKKKD